jgi:signal transduction histidine kinase
MQNGGKIAITTRLIKGYVEIAISDTGIGIPVKQLKKIFDPFFTTKEVGKGTGLGLSISHGIIGKHGGELKVESEINRGSRFTIILPHETSLKFERT